MAAILASEFGRSFFCVATTNEFVMSCVVYGPIVVSVHIGTSDQWRFYNKHTVRVAHGNVRHGFLCIVSFVQIMRGCPDSDKPSSHTVLLVGFGTRTTCSLDLGCRQQDYWIAKNSWCVSFAMMAFVATAR